ncbi:hypothetical protein PUN28_005838 [Cardiocondyla obscurior]|uniref:Uncharacterized protein n=1 Tax=Cardiocondyla obscurior TaxID=286306 RepID=A0AAW2G5Z3_9HYME
MAEKFNYRNRRGRKNVGDFQARKLRGFSSSTSDTETPRHYATNIGRSKAIRDFYARSSHFILGNTRSEVESFRELFNARNKIIVNVQDFIRLKNFPGERKRNAISPNGEYRQLFRQKRYTDIHFRFALMHAYYFALYYYRGINGASTVIIGTLSYASS